MSLSPFTNSACQHDLKCNWKTKKQTKTKTKQYNPRDSRTLKLSFISLCSAKDTHTQILIFPPQITNFGYKTENEYPKINKVGHVLYFLFFKSEYKK